LEACALPVLDRASFEQEFGLRRRRAIELMHGFGGYQAGRTFLGSLQELLKTPKYR
jgi:allophanate hydrolase subunit 1